MDLTEYELCIAVPGENHIVDVVHPETGRTAINHKTLDDVRLEKGYEHAQLMTLDFFAKSKAIRQDTPVVWGEVTEERYMYGLEVLPPAVWIGDDFMVGEPCDHHALTGRPRYRAFRMQDEKYYEASRPMQVAEFKEARTARI